MRVTAAGRPVRAVFPAVAIALSRVRFRRRKIDVLELKNGDRLRVEIKELKHGRLTVKTDDLSGKLFKDFTWNLNAFDSYDSARHPARR